MSEQRISPDLDGVPETLLWTLYYRSLEAGRPDAVLQDPLAAELVSRIDYPFAERLGRGSTRAQWQGLRAATFDQRIRDFAAAYPGGSVVSLGEGLETQFWRVDDGRIRWTGVDLPAAAPLRQQVLPPHDRHRQVAASVLDDRWMNDVDQTRGVLITAQGLLMYLQPEQVYDLFERCARRFPAAEFVFDGVPRWTRALTTRLAAGPGGGSGARADGGSAPGAPGRPGAMPPPAMPWAMDGREAAVLRGLRAVRTVTRLHPPRGRGLLYGSALPVVDRVPVLRALVLSVWSAELAVGR